MSAGPATKARGHFPLLDLPREVRDMVYTAALVRDPIKIGASECRGAAINTNTKAEAEDNDEDEYDSDSDYEPTLCDYELRKPAHFRTTWLWERHLGPPLCATYQECHYSGYTDHPILNFFYVSRQVYREAFPIYYSQNKFVFMGQGDKGGIAINTCLAFLQDRPPLAMLEIRSISLDLGGDIDTFREPIGGWLNYEALDDTWDPLMVTIKSRMKLDWLGLVLRGWSPDVRQNPWNWLPASAPYDTIKPKKWVGSLLTLRNLKALQIDISTEHYFAESSDNAMVRGVAFIQLIRSKILKNGARLGSKNIRVESRHHFFCGHRVRGRWIHVEAHDDEYGQSQLVKRIRPDDGGSEKSYTDSDGGDNDSLISLHG